MAERTQQGGGNGPVAVQAESQSMKWRWWIGQQNLHSAYRGVELLERGGRQARKAGGWLSEASEQSSGTFSPSEETEYSQFT